MAEQTLLPQVPFAGIVKSGTFGAMHDRESPVTLMTRSDLRMRHIAARKGKSAELRRAVLDATGLELPAGPKRVGNGGLALIGVAPGQWLATSDSEAPGGLSGKLMECLSGLATSVDQSGSRAVVRISSPRVRDVLAKGCGLDLHPRVFAPGDAATSDIALIGCTLWQLDETPSFEIAVGQSFAGSFWSWLTGAAAEFGYDVRTARR